MTTSVEPRYPLRLVMARTGLSADLLRAWERRYGAVRPRRTAGGQRLYSDGDIERLGLMQRLVHEGHSIGEIARLAAPALLSLLEEPPVAHSSADALEAVVEKALEATLRLDATALEASLRRAALVHGSAAFIDQVLPRFLRTVGKRWHAGSLSVAHEHLASATVRKVVWWTTEAFAPAANAPRVVIATPPGEEHELGALLLTAAALEEGWRVVYLGANVPADDLIATVRQAGPRAVALSVVYASGRTERTVLAQIVRTLSPTTDVIIGGEAAHEQRIVLRKAGARVIPDFAGFRSTLRSLRSSTVEGARGE